MSELREGLSMAIDAGDLPEEAMMSNGIFKICYYEGRVVATAYELMVRAWEIYKQLRDSANMVTAYNNLALCAYKSGKKEVAAEYFRNALDVCCKNGIKKAVVQQRNEALRLKVQNRNNLITSGVVIALLLLLHSG